MKPTRTLSLALGFVGGLLIGATSQALRLAILEKQNADKAAEPAPRFLTDTPTDPGPPSSGSTVEG